MAITTIKIFPSIGVARLGNSPEEFFIGPEFPGDTTPPAGGYKDKQCRMKRQAARFRLFGYNEADILVKEITAEDASISWTAHLANTKGAWYKFTTYEVPFGAKRNDAVADRSTLVIDPGPRTLTGPNQAASFNTGHFKNVQVPLGEMRTDSEGHLLILGGSGKAGSPGNSPLTHWAQSDDWYDDVSDGPINASVVLNGSNTVIQAAPAWVVCAPPKFAPVIDNAVTLYDVLLQVAVDKLNYKPPSVPSFNQHIFPVLDRAMKMKWVTKKAAFAHDPLAAVFPPANEVIRQGVIPYLRNPDTPPHLPGPPQATMPKQWSDVFDITNKITLALTKVQYNYMLQWAAGNFENDWTGTPPVPQPNITPEGLNQAALENCVGGAFYPGIETSWMTRDVYEFTEPFRLHAAAREPGDLTKQMALPWHSDFYDCSDGDSPHSWWPAQRPVDVWPEDGSPQIPWIRDLITSSGPASGFFMSMVENWFRLGIIVKKGDDYLETERHVVCKSLTIVTDRSTFGKDEVDGMLTAGSPAVFKDSFYVIAEGFLPVELGIASNDPVPANINSIAPQISFTRPDNSIVQGLAANAQKILFEDNSVPPLLRQRFTFVYQASFSNTNAFENVESEKEVITAAGQGLQASGSVTLINQPNPFMLDGPVSWLSLDVRVFQIKQDESLFGVEVGATPEAALSFIQNVLAKFNTGSQGAAFDTIPFDQQTSPLELSRSIGGKKVFNFAIAKVRYSGKVLQATDVRVFFRLFTTAVTGLEYNTGSTYRNFNDGAKVVPLIGFQGGEVVSIPCFAEARIDPLTQSMQEQKDLHNIRTILPQGTAEANAYFGCWLDINQEEKVMPLQPFSGDGPYADTNMRSIQNTIRGLHQCLVAELYFPPTPIAAGDTPASSDHLAQRNLAIVESDNPGSLGSRTIVHTFELKPSAAEKTGTTHISATASSPLPADELMLQWHNLPRDADVTVYFPQSDAALLLQKAGTLYEAKRLELVDEHTIRCKVGDLTYIPVPGSPGVHLAGLITIQLPPGIRYGQVFRVTAHQISGSKKSRKIIGAFQITIPVVKATNLLESEMRRLAVLGSIGRSVQTDSRWNKIFDRYLKAVSDRVSGFGGDPSIVTPSPDGFDLHKKPPCGLLCRLIKMLVRIISQLWSMIK